MNPVAAMAGMIASISGIAVGLMGVIDGIPIMAGSGFAVTAALQVWTMGKLGPINIRLAVIEERLNRMEEQAGRKRVMHRTPNVE